jgi:Flp pilus assembly protein TadD
MTGRERLYVCDRCGATTANANAYARTGSLLRTRVFCPTCYEVKARRGGLQTLAGVVAMALVGLWLMSRGTGVSRSARANEQLGELLVFVAIVYVASFIHVVPHELGHAILGAATRFRVPRITVGVGGALVDRKIGRTTVVVHTLPVSGATYGATDDRRALRLRLWLFTAGGPATTALLTLLAWRAEPLVTATGPSLLLQAWVFAGVLVLVGSLLPMRAGATTTDGWKLLATPFLGDDKLDALLVSADALDVHEQVRRGDHDEAISAAQRLVRERPDDVSLHVELVAALLKAQRWDEAAVALRDQLARLPLRDEVRALHLNNLAWADLMIGDPALLPEADRASAEAYAAQPWRHAIRGTRGSVLIDTGRAAEGVELVRSGILRSQSPASVAATQAYLAMGELQLGNLWRAREHYGTAHHADPDHRLVRRAGDRLAGAEIVAVLGHGWAGRGSTDPGDRDALAIVAAEQGPRLASLAGAARLVATRLTADQARVVIERGLGRPLGADVSPAQWLDALAGALDEARAARR